MTTESSSPTPSPSRRRIWLIVLLVAVVAAGGVLALTRVLEEEASAVASFPVQQGEFVISLSLKGGELEALEAERIIAPRVRGDLKIVELFPEGEQVEIGDLLVQFEETEFDKRVLDAEQRVESAKAELEKIQATQKAELARLEGAIKDQDANLRLAQLQVEKMEFEASVDKAKAEIDALKAQLSHDQAVKKLEAQKIINAADIKTRELEISRTERELEKAQRELKSITIKAEKPGLVVYGKVWKGERPEKIRVGDSIWGGVEVISLPDLTKMKIKTYVNEVDVDKLKVGQQALVKLDALPEPTFHGAITSIASLGREKEGEKNVKVFDVELEVEEEDKRLKPGMSATSEVIVETIPPRPVPVPDSVAHEAAEEVVETPPEPLYIPLDAVFEENGETVVYRMVDGLPQARTVTLGKKNDNYVIVEEGLGPDDRVTLRDPTLTLDMLGGIPEPEAKSEAPQTVATE